MLASLGAMAESGRRAADLDPGGNGTAFQMGESLPEEASPGSRAVLSRPDKLL